MKTTALLLLAVAAGASAAKPSNNVVRNVIDANNKLTKMDPLAEFKQVRDQMNELASKDLKALTIEGSEIIAREAKAKRSISSCASAASDLISDFSSGDIETACGDSAQNDIFEIFSASESELAEIPAKLCGNTCIVQLRKSFLPMFKECEEIIDSVPSIGPVAIIKAMFKLVPIVSDMICSQDSSGNYCLSQLASMQDNLETLDITSSTMTSSALQSALSTTCTECFTTILDYVGKIADSFIGSFSVGSNAPSISNMLGLVCSQDTDEDYCLAEFFSFVETMNTDNGLSFSSDNFNLTATQISVINDVVCESTCLRQGLNALFPSGGDFLSMFAQDTVCYNDNGRTCLSKTLTAASVSLPTVVSACKTFDPSTMCTSDNTCVTNINSFISYLGCCAAPAAFVLEGLASMNTSNAFTSCDSFTSLSSISGCTPTTRPISLTITFGNGMDLSSISTSLLEEALKADFAASFMVSTDAVTVVINGNTITVSLSVPDSVTALSGIALPGVSSKAGSMTLSKSEALFSVACTSTSSSCYEAASVEYTDPNMDSGSSTLNIGFGVMALSGCVAAAHAL